MAVKRPASADDVAGQRSGGATPLGFSGAGINAARPFGSAPITVDAQMGYDPGSALAGFSTLNPIDSNEAWKALVGYQWRSLNVKAGVNQFFTNFTGPLALSPSPFNSSQVTLGGTELDSTYYLTSSLVLSAGGQFYDGRSNSGQQSLLGANDHLNKANVGVSYDLAPGSSLALGYEWVQWNLSNSNGTLNAAGKPTEQYITIGIGQNVSKNAAFKLLYQIGDYKDNGTGFTSANLPNNEGGSVIGQATIKF